MKRHIFLFTPLLFCLTYFSHAQSSFKERYIIYPNFDFSMGFPQTNFDRYVDPWRFGFKVDVFISPRKEPLSIVETGFQFGLLSIGSKDDLIDGIDISTSSELIDISYKIGLKIPITDAIKVRPNFAIGFNFSTTSSSYEVVDKATFLERFSGIQEEDIVENVQVNSYNDTGSIYSFGIGFILKEIFYVDFRLVNGGAISFVDKSSIYVENGEVLYDPKESSVKYYSVGLGFSLIRVVESMRE